MSLEKQAETAEFNAADDIVADLQNDVKRNDEEKSERLALEIQAEVNDFQIQLGLPLNRGDDSRTLPLLWVADAGIENGLTQHEQNIVIERIDQIHLADSNLSYAAKRKIYKTFDIQSILDRGMQTRFCAAVLDFCTTRDGWDKKKEGMEFALTDKSFKMMDALATQFASMPAETRAPLGPHVKVLLKASGWKVAEWNARIDGKQQQEEEASTEDLLQKMDDAIAEQGKATLTMKDLYEDPYGRPAVFLNQFDTEENRFMDIATHLVAADTLKLLQDNEQANLYQRAGVLGMLRCDENGTWEWEMLDDGSVRGVIGRGVAMVRFKWHGAGDDKRAVVDPLATPPRVVGEDILRNQEHFGIKALNSIITHPYLFNGTFYRDTGYNAETGIFYPESAACELVYPDSSEEAVRLIKEVLQDFDLIGEADLENAIALMLTPIVRHDLTDLPPMYSITAAKEGSGKSFLAKCLLTPTVGGEPTVTKLSHNSDEVRKRLFSAMMEARSYTIVDNVDPTKPLDSAELASFITEKFHEDRLLYTQKLRKVENRCTFVYTGSNVETTAELVDRSVQVKIKAPTKRVADRDFACNPLEDMLIPNRGIYLGALCYMVQKWLDDGKPLNKEARHRQRNWAHVVGGILQANGIGEHFLTNDAEMRIAANPEHVKWGHALQSIAHQLGYERVTSEQGFCMKDIFLICSFENSYYDGEGHVPERGDNMLGEFIVTRGRENKHRSTALGKLFRSKVGTPYAGWEIEYLRHTQNAAYYRLIDRGAKFEHPPEPGGNDGPDPSETNQDTNDDVLETVPF